MSVPADALIATILRRELPSGVSWDDARAKADHGDRGGLTRGGITAANAGRFLGLGRDAIAAELNAMTEMQAYAFYRAYGGPYWDVPEPLRAMLMDWSVTSGSAAGRGLQTALVRQGAYRKPDGSVASVDGVVGPLTLAGLARATDQRRLYWDVFESMLRHYISAACNDRRIPPEVRRTTNVQYGVGWVNNRVIPFILRNGVTPP